MKEATDRLYEKALAEQDGYRQWLLAQPPEEILKNAYEYALREDIIYYLEDSDIGDELAEALLKSPYPVYEVVRYYEKMDTDKKLTVYAVRNSPFGLPCFFVNIDGEWRYISARYFSFV